MNKLLVVSVVLSLAATIAIAAEEQSVVTITVQPAAFGQLSDKHLGALADGLQQVALVAPSKANIDAYLEAQREILSRAAAKVAAPTTK